MNKNSQIVEKSNIKIVVLLALFSTVLFLNTLENDFTYDDLKVVQWNPFLVEDANPKELLKEGRVVRTLTLILDHKLFGLNPSGYHLQNIFWHVLSTILLYFLILRLSGNKTTSILSSILFAAHPIHVEAVANISNRKDTISLAFSLVTFLFYLKSYECKRERRHLIISLAFVSFMLAMLAKQSAVVIPVMLYAYEFYFISPGKSRLLYDNRHRLWKFMAVFIVYGIYYLWAVIRGFLELNVTFRVEELFLTTTRMLLFYNNILLWPVNMSADHIFVLSNSLTEPKVQAALITWFIFTWVIIKLFKKVPLISFGLLWYLVTLLPVLFIPGTGYFAAERYLYMPSVGFVLIFAVALEKLLKHRYRASFLLLAAITALYSINTLNRNTIWSNNMTLWLDTLKKDPMSIRAILTKASLYHYNGEPEKAIPFYLKALEILPEDPGTINNLGSIYADLGRYDEAIRLYKNALSTALSPRLNLSNYKLINGLYEVSLKEYQAKLQDDPGNIEVYFQLGVLYVKMGENNKAIKAFEYFVEKWGKDRRYTAIAVDEIRKLKK